jgi:hypothetical protein
MHKANSTILRQVSRKQWAQLPKNNPVWVRFKATSNRLFRFIIERNKLAASPAELVLRLPFGAGTIICPAAEMKSVLCLACLPYRQRDVHFTATDRGITVYVL